MLHHHNIKWKGMVKDVQEFIKTCGICQKIIIYKDKFSKEYGQLPRFLPNECIFADFLGPFPRATTGEIYILTLVSSGDWYLSVHATMAASAPETLRCLIKDIGHFGFPRNFWSDQGSHFTAEVIKLFCEFFQIKVI